MTNNNVSERVLTNSELSDIFSGFKNDRERIKYMSRAYKKMSISKAFSIFYDVELSNEVRNNNQINKIVNIELGKVYLGTLKTYNEYGMTFSIPGVKEILWTKETFSDCRDAVENYLLNHNNQMFIEVREKRADGYLVSVINGYYHMWMDSIENAIRNRMGITAHIDSFAIGVENKARGYLCHTQIGPLNELTGKNYISSVFIPGSQIVLNIERDFEKWIGKDVTVVPQKVTMFRSPGNPAETSIVCSRKIVLQIEGMVNMHEIYMNTKKNKTSDVYEGTITGIINSSNKTGAFVELNGKYITGLMPIDSLDIFNYQPGKQVKVKIKEFEMQEGREPFEYNKKTSSIKRCNIRPVFELVNE